MRRFRGARLMPPLQTGEIDKRENTMSKLILLVDDSVTSLLRSRAFFGDQTKYRVISARDGAEGVEKALAHLPDLILMDVEMPRMSGIEACRALRNNKATKRIPIILLTMRGEDAAVKAGLGSGCDEYMLKPVNEESLANVLKKYLR